MAIFTINHLGIVVATAITVLQYKAGATNKAAVVRFRVTQRLSETSQQEVIQLLRKTAAATVTSFTPMENDPDGAVAFGAGGTAATGITATVEGTDGDVLVSSGFNVLNGFEWVRSDRDEIKVPAAGIIAIKFPVAPTSATWDIQLVIEEF